MKIINQRHLFLACLLGTMAVSAGMLLHADGLTLAGSTEASCCSDISAPTIIAGTNVTAEVEAKAKPDLLKTCPVSGDTLGEMGAPYKLVYNGQLVKLCCPGCKKDFLKDPDKYLAIVRAADKSAGSTAKN